LSTTIYAKVHLPTQALAVEAQGSILTKNIADSEVLNQVERRVGWNRQAATCDTTTSLTTKASSNPSFAWRRLATRRHPCRVSTDDVVERVRDGMFRRDLTHDETARWQAYLLKYRGFGGAKCHITSCVVVIQRTNHDWAAERN
jgi:hypothetical protein